ncbi:MAG: SIMPL domain-containing protein [Chitinophagaceae bacterium]|nr:SIMPL domain-containing protein [Chitinophagaceae bacterium]
MKRFIITLLVFSITIGAFAQQINPYPKTIQVTGSAETNIIPDEIYVIVTLKEYEKKGTGKISLDKIKSDFLGYCKNIGLPDSAVSIASYEGYNNYPWWRKRKTKDELYSSISYQVKFNSSTKMDQLVDKLDDDATQNFVIAKLSHSKIAEYRKQLKIQAIKAAKDKATYMAEAIGENLGAAVTITEPGDAFAPDLYRAAQSNSYAYLSRDKDGVADGEKGVDFKNIQLRFEVNAVFALK